LAPPGPARGGGPAGLAARLDCTAAPRGHALAEPRRPGAAVAGGRGRHWRLLRRPGSGPPQARAQREPEQDLGGPDRWHAAVLRTGTRRLVRLAANRGGWLPAGPARPCLSAVAGGVQCRR